MLFFNRRYLLVAHGHILSRYDTFKKTWLREHKTFAEVIDNEEQKSQSNNTNMIVSDSSKTLKSKDVSNLHEEEEKTDQD